MGVAVERFRLLGALGAGGAGQVVLVEDRLRPGSRLALKELLGGGDDGVAALHREFATLATLRHPNLVEVFELLVDAETGRPQFTMEHVEGDDFVATVKREGPDSLAPLAAETLRALAFLHDFGLVHRDLKPGNVLVRRSPKVGHRVVVLDFGLAVARQHDPTTATPAMAGTLSYLAPELFDNAAPTKRSDLYALGAMIYEAVHGKAPFVMKGNDVAAFMAAIREGRRARPKIPGGFHAGLTRWIDDLLSPDPADRPSSAIDALARLNEACGLREPLETMDDRAARLGSGVPVGRDDELAALRAELAPSAAARVVWLCGDAGSGKTRILRFLAAEGAGAGWRVHVPPGALPESPDAFVERVRADAAAGPTVVLLDEIERADNAVASFLDRVAREPREAPVHVVAAVRPGELQNPRLKKLLTDTGVVPSLARVELAPLREPGLKAMIERATAGQSSAQARVKWLLDASEGNAGAAEALLVEGVWERKARIPAARVLEQSIRRRLDALSPEARAWMEVLAVLGDDVPESLVEELCGFEERSAAAAAEAIAAGLARRTGGGVSPDSRRVADATKAAADPERTHRLHAMAATHYAAQARDVFGATAWRLARLWRGAGETDRALAAALDAASAAEVAKAWAEAAERLRFALSLLRRRDPRRASLWMRNGDALRQATLHHAAVRAYGWAARHLKSEAERRMARARRARALLNSGRLDAAELAADGIVRSDLGSRFPASTALALVVVSHVRIQRFEFLEAFESGNRAAGLAGDIPADIRADTLIVAAGAGWRLNEPQADAHGRAAESLARDSNLPEALMLLLATRATAEERRNQFDKLEATLVELATIAAVQQRPDLLRRSTHQTVRLHALVGRFDRAVAVARSAMELSQFSANPVTGATAAILCAESLLDAGRTGEAIPVLLRQVEHPMPETPGIWVRYARMVLARAIVESEFKSPGDARLLLEGTLQAFQTKGHLVYLDALIHELIWRNSPGCPEPLDPILQSAESALGNGFNDFPEGGLARLQLQIGLVHANRRNFEAVVSTLRDASPSPGVPVTPHIFGRIQFALAEAFTALGRADEARACFQRGQELIQMAADRISDPDWRRDFLDQPIIRKLLASVPKPSEAKRIEALYDMIRALNSETDPEALLESSLQMAMHAVDAERGMILLSGPTGSDFSVRLARNLEKETEADAEAFSRRIIAQAELGESVLALDAGQDERFKEFKSVSLFRIRSLMCVPLRSRGRIVGTVYLDSRRQGKLFTTGDLRFVEAFADHAALALENVRRWAELENENRRLKAVVGERSSYGKIIGRAPAMQRVFDLLERVAASDMTVLIQGESGTGKELVARALHFNGPRKDKAFVSENCAALPDTLLESELFGHVKGAFTGAERDRAGLFEQSHDGTLFLDEVGDTSPALQARLLRVLQEGELRRVGGDHPIKVNVRVITATNKDLQAEIAAGRFREDLYYRLAVVPVQLPPLRERLGDVPFLVGHLLEQIASARGRVAPRIESEVLDAMERYPWPGNVRQLENVLRRVSMLAGDLTITRGVIELDADLSRMLFGKQAVAGPLLSMVKTEEEQIRRALEAAGGNRDRAARLLGISRATIYRKMREYSLR
jgi:transcriptional regulator with GAF, ATPase, and Fis domain